MPKHLTGSNVHFLVLEAEDIVKLLPEPETQPGRSPETEGDLSKWKLSDLANEILMISMKKKMEKLQFPGTQQTTEPIDQELVDEMEPYLQEYAWRVDEYLQKQEYSAENRPVLNSALRAASVITNMCIAGVDLDGALNRMSGVGGNMIKSLMDTTTPDYSDKTPEERKAALDEYENKAKNSPLYEMIQTGLDNMQLGGEYQLALQDQADPMTPEKKKEFDGRFLESLKNIKNAVKKVEDTILKPDFPMEDHPYMKDNTIANLKHSRSVPSMKRRSAQEEALLQNGYHPEDYLSIFGLGYATARIASAESKNNMPLQVQHQTRADMARFMSMLEMTMEIYDHPSVLTDLKKELDREGVSLKAYMQGMQEQMLADAEEMVNDASLSEREQDFLKESIKELSDRFQYDPQVPDDEVVRAMEIIDAKAQAAAAKALSLKDPADVALDRELAELELNTMPSGWELPKDNAALLTDAEYGYISGALTNSGGFLQDEKKGDDYILRYGQITGLIEADQMTYHHYSGSGVSTRYFSRAKEITTPEGEKKIVHPDAEMKEMLGQLNTDVREMHKKVPEGNRLQHAMLNYTESVTREALEQKEPATDAGKDGIIALANGLWANITEPGRYKNLPWLKVEQLNDKYGFSYLMQDCVSAHEIYRKSVQRANAGIVDEAREAKERELYGRLLDRLEKKAGDILSVPEEQRHELAGFFASANSANVTKDIFGERGVKIFADTAQGYRRGLEKGWPIHELPVYVVLEKYANEMNSVMQKAGDAFYDELRISAAAFQEAVNKDISGLNEKERSLYFQDLSEKLHQLNTYREVEKNNPDLRPDAKNLLSGPETDTTGYGCGKSLGHEVAEDVLTGVAQNCMKRAIILGQAEPKDLQGLQTEAQKHALEDAQLMQDRVGDAYQRMNKSRFAYQEMLKKLKSLKKEGEENSDYFNDMEKALTTLSEMDGNSSAADFMKAYGDMQQAAQTYHDKRSGIHIFSAWKENGKQRRDLAEELATMAGADRESMKGFMEKEDLIAMGGAADLERFKISNRNVQRGRINPYESFDSQLLRYTDTIEKNTLPKMQKRNELRRQRIDGGLNGLKQQEAGDGAGPKPDYAMLRMEKNNGQNVIEAPVVTGAMKK